MDKKPLQQAQGFSPDLSQAPFRRNVPQWPSPKKQERLLLVRAASPEQGAGYTPPAAPAALLFTLAFLLSFGYVCVTLCP